MSVSRSANSSAPPFRLSPSDIARYFFLDCERFLRFQAAGKELRDQEGIPRPEFDHSPLLQSLLDSGYVWEREVLEKHLGGRVHIAPGQGELHTRRFSWDETLRLLRTAEPGSFIYQPTLRPPAEFYTRYGLDPQLVTISDNHPDLLAVHGGRVAPQFAAESRSDSATHPSARTLRVLDLKRGESLRLAHRVQILLYALELDAILATSGLDLSVDQAQGEVWLGGQPAPTPFDLHDFRPHLETFLRRDLVRILRGSPDAARWHVHDRCEWCEFFDHCRDEMRQRNDLSRLSQLTAYGKRFLRDELQVHSLPELATFLDSRDADERLARSASLAGGRPRLAKQLAALESQSPQPNGAASPALSKGENVGLFLTLQQEPLGHSIYLAGIHLTTRQDLRDQIFSPDVAEKFFDPKGKSRPFVLVADRPDATADIRRQWGRVLHDIVVQVHAYNDGREWADQLSLQAYVLAEQERELLVRWLLESLEDAEQPDLAEQAMTLLFHFQAPELLVVDRHPDREVPFPVVVLLDALGHVLALPVEVAYTLPESLAALGSKFPFRRNDYFHFPLGPGFRADAIHAAWFRGKTEVLPDLAAQAVAYLRAVRELLQSIRQHAGDAIFAWAAKFALPARQEFADPLLSRLAFFSRYESLLACLDQRHARCEPREVQRLLGQVLELRCGANGEFAVVGGAAMEVESGGFPEWLLVTDDEPGRRAQLEYRDYACRAQLWQGKSQPNLAVVGVAEVRRDKFGMLAGLTFEFAKPFATEPRPGDRFLLYPRFTDFTTDGVVKFLQRYGEIRERLGDGELFLRLLSSSPIPAVPAVSSVPSVPTLTRSQRTAFDTILSQRVVPVWGPPGTGKTHFLASVILALASAAGREKRPFHVLITAFTHAAIENLMRKLVSLADSKLAVGKVKNWQSESVDGIETIEDKQVAKWLKQHPVSVIGSTTYSCLKEYDKLPEFDLVVIDEASQVRVPESAVPISLAGRNGRLILAGDHLQLPPIVAGVYPEPPNGQPSLHRSIFEAVSASSCGATRPHVQLTENFRMNDVLTSFAAGLLYGPDYKPVDETVAGRRLDLVPERSLDPFVEACLDPQSPLVVVVLDGVWAARENPLEAQLVAQLVGGLRNTLRTADGNGKLFADDAAFFRDGVFLVSPHRAQIRQIERELRRQRRWASPPFVDTVDKMQGQEAEAVIVSYGVSDPEFAAQEAEFIYGLNRLNVAVTRARSKCVVFLPRPLLDASPAVLDRPEATRGLAFMRELVAAVARVGEEQTFSLDDGATATVYRAAKCFQAETRAAEVRVAGAESSDPQPELPIDAAPPPSVTQPITPKRATPTRPPLDPAIRTVFAAQQAQLNDSQREAAIAGDEPLLIIAGAGTGKTTTLVHRVAHLLSTGIRPERLLLLTFTRRAANQMLGRVADLLQLDDISRRVWGGTFHGVATRLLRIYGGRIGIDPRFTIHDRGDSEDLMHNVCQQLGVSESDKKFPKKGTQVAIHSFMKNAQQSLADTLTNEFAAHEKFAERLEKLFAGYAARKAELNVFDYDDLLLKWADLLDDPEAGPAIRGRFDCVLVDEYQDTNRLQSRLLRGLRPDGRGLSVVGDDAQSIYSFRAATIRNILDFPQEFPGTRVVKLEQNYRSTPPILAVSNAVIEESSQRHEKQLWSSRPAGPQPQLVSCYSEYEQAEFVVKRIQEHVTAGVPISQQAVLFRAAHHSIALEAELTRRRITFVKYGGLKFVESAHVKDLMSFLRLAENPRDIVAGQRVLLLLPGIGAKKAEQLQQAAEADGASFAAWQQAKPPAKAADIWPRFVELIRGLAAATDDLPTQVERTLAFYQPLLEEQYDNPKDRLADLVQLKEMAGRYTDRSAMLADLTIDPPSSTAELPDAPEGEALVLSTMHSAKGLEWKVVYVINANDGSIPLPRAAQELDSLEEERRMFYVALTRAADWLYVSYPKNVSAQYNAWYASFTDPGALTRFVTPDVKRHFESQSAGSFRPPSESSSGSVPTRKRRAKASRK